MTKIQIIETVVTIILFLIIKFLINRYTARIVANNPSTKTRSKVVKKALNLTILVIFIIILFSIFGVDQSELAVFIGSVLTVMGIVLHFAQWSILSNITSGIIIFFNHSVKLDDTITILDKDYEIEGRISDIGLFFVILKTKDNELINIPNSVFLNKMIKRNECIMTFN
ncbi:MAG: mechanosensitive ion channel [Flavobacteriaceae bacterium]|nr:mechanosensitive ion channel [Flavobacteriaceae bacterium]